MLLAFHISSCSEAAVSSETVAVNNTGTPGNASTPDVNSTSTPVTKSSSNSEAVDPFYTKNHVKQSGWQIPISNKRRYIRTEEIMMPIKKGKEVRVTTTDYGYSYEDSWAYSEDSLHPNGPMKLESVFFTEYNVKGKVFMYSILVKEVKVPPPSNSDDPGERFLYKIQDTDGDGVFETLVHGDEILVPKWVLK